MDSSLTMEKKKQNNKTDKDIAREEAERKRQETLEYQRQRKKDGCGCVKGSVRYREDCDRWYVSWYDEKQKKSVKIPKYNGKYMYNENIAKELLGKMQSDCNKGIFYIEKYKRSTSSDVMDYMEIWYDENKEGWRPATQDDYRNSIKKHIAPFFKEHSKIMLDDIKLDLLLKLKKSINRGPKGQMNVMDCFHTFMKYAHKNDRVLKMPHFPERKSYQYVEPKIEWLFEDDQEKIIKFIPTEHQPIFWWLKYHYRRPSEAFALHKIDYDEDKDEFVVKRTISSDKLIDIIKESQIQIIPCHPKFKKIMAEMPKTTSKFFFSCEYSRQPGKRYTRTIFANLWRDACVKAEIKIKPYAGTKHSSCSQYINEYGRTYAELQVVTGHASMKSVKKYGKTETRRKRELLAVEKIVNLAEERDKRKANE